MEEEDRLWRALHLSEGRIEALEETLPKIVHEAVKEAMPDALLSDDQYRWVLLAIERESQSIAFRRAVIEKTIIALVWSLVAGLAALAWILIKEYAITHGWRP